MPRIKRIEISGFRGIYKPPLELEFTKGANLRSMVIHGRNGTGKSSIVDGLEWLLTGEIDHLKKEGAGHSAYPHNEAGGEETYVEVEFAPTELDSLKKVFDFTRITQPTTRGPLDEIVGKFQHLPILRYRDITDFVYKTKAQKYEFLAKQMGLKGPQQIQDKLKTTSNRLGDEVESSETGYTNAKAELAAQVRASPPTRDALMEHLNELFRKVEIDELSSLDELPSCWTNLRSKVEEDDKTQRLSDLREAKDEVSELLPLPAWDTSPEEFEEELGVYEELKGEFADLILHQLYTAGQEALEHTGEPDICPLCGEPYDEGDLAEHIQEKRKALDDLDEQKKRLEDTHQGFKQDLTTLHAQVRSNKPPELEQPPTELYDEIREACIKLEPRLEEAIVALGDSLEDTDTDHVYGEIENDDNLSTLREAGDHLPDALEDEIGTLEGDDQRTQLVDAFEEVKDTWTAYRTFVARRARKEALEGIQTQFERIREEVIENVQTKMTQEFDQISEDVAQIFNILERDHTEITDPQVLFPEEKDKAVVLQAKLGGHPVAPAYAQLSESQLNSFGLAVFLASTRNFNPEFEFVVLDDVINSFDGYKRPRVIEVLNEHFQDKQLLLLTHDKVWMRRLTREKSRWLKKRFSGWDYGIGPTVRGAGDDIDRIGYFIDEDQPGDAGRRFGVYLEWILQDLCQNMQASLKYRQAQDYSLYELLLALRKRLSKKTDEDDLVEQVKVYEDSTWFRNFSAHWKEPDIEMTTEELSEYLDKWLEIEELLRCGECGRLVEYKKESGHEHVECPCRELSLGT